MKNFLSVLKTALAGIFSDANFSEETNESEVISFLEGKEGSFAEIEQLKADLAQAQKSAKDDKASTEKVQQDQETAMSNMLETINALNTKLTSMESEMTKLQGGLNKITAGFENKPKDEGGDTAPITKNESEEGANQFSIGKMSDRVLKNVKSGMKVG